MCCELWTLLCAGVAFSETEAHTRLRRDILRQRKRSRPRPGSVQTLPERPRLDRLYLLHHNCWSALTRLPHRQSVLRLLGVQDGRLFAVASQQDAQIAMWLAVRINGNNMKDTWRLYSLECQNWVRNLIYKWVTKIFMPRIILTV